MSYETFKILEFEFSIDAKISSRLYDILYKRIADPSSMVLYAWHKQVI